MALTCKRKQLLWMNKQSTWVPRCCGTQKPLCDSVRASSSHHSAQKRARTVLTLRFTGPNL